MCVCVCGPFFASQCHVTPELHAQSKAERTLHYKYICMSTCVGIFVLTIFTLFQNQVVCVVDALPRNAMGKVEKSKIKALFDGPTDGNIKGA